MMNQLLISDDSKARDVAPLCRTFGIGIEVQSFYDARLVEQSPEALEEHKQIIHGIAPVSVHGCFGDLCPGSFDALVREVARQRMELSYHVARTLGAGHLVLHHGYVPHTSYPPRWLERSTRFWQDFLDGKDANIRIHLENLLELDPELISDVVRSVDRVNLDINLDVGHAHCYSHTPVTGWIERLGPQIGYAHLHDNLGENDDHLGLGQGTLPLKEVCQALNEYAPQAVWTLEVGLDSIRQSLDWLGENGFLT